MTDSNNNQPAFSDALAVNIGSAAINAHINQTLDQVFDVGEISDIQKQGLVDAISKEIDAGAEYAKAYEFQQQAAQFSDLPNSPQYLNAISNMEAAQNTGNSLMNQARQALSNANLNAAQMTKLAKFASNTGAIGMALEMAFGLSTDNANVVGMTATGILTGFGLGMAVFHLLKNFTPVGLLFSTIGGVLFGIEFGPNIGKNYIWPFISEYLEIGENESFFEPIFDSVNDFFQDALDWIPRGDPLTLDLDGDGIETIASDGTVLFDHDGDGTKTSTGWIQSDDGIVVMDRNNNGVIDNGRELFGDNTIKADGSIAVDGFDALSDLDSNADGLVDASDISFSRLRIWRDFNADGISQSNELFTLDQLGIESIGTACVAANTKTEPVSGLES